MPLRCQPASRLKEESQILSLLGWLSELVKEVVGEVVFTVLQVLLGHAALVENRNVQTELLALEHVRVKEVNDLATVLPGPRAQDSGTINCICTHVVVH